LNDTIFEKEKEEEEEEEEELLNIKHVFGFLYKFCLNISHSKKN
jgi:hypothetical protein